MHGPYYFAERNPCHDGTSLRLPRLHKAPASVGTFVQAASVVAGVAERLRFDARPLGERERGLIRAAETRAWDEPLLSMLRRAVVNRGFRYSPHDDCGMLADVLTRVADA